jgi:hypothetical protein
MKEDGFSKSAAPQFYSLIIKALRIILGLLVLPVLSRHNPKIYSPRYAARTFGSSSMVFASPDMVTRPESIT